MGESIQIQIAAILGLSALAQWIGWRLKIPSILILLATGFLIGPVFNLIDVELLFGDLLKPLVSASVAILLFEGGLTLRLKELKHDGWVIFRLVTIGVFVTFALATYFLVELLDFDLKTAALFGALLALTGPTVIVPVLRTVRPKGSVKFIAKWEGIVNDPIAVLLAVFIFELFILNPSGDSFWTHLLLGILKTLLVAGVCSWAGARLMVYLVRHRMLPEFLHNLLIL
ncbi:MAG: cation:proton antiporter, partial [Verrucomicrobiota bacterium]